MTMLRFFLKMWKTKTNLLELQSKYVFRWNSKTGCKVLTLWRARQLSFFYVQILPELKNKFVLKEVDFICCVIIKVKLLYKISGMKFSSLESGGFAVKPPPVKRLSYYWSSFICFLTILYKKKNGEKITNNYFWWIYT